MRPLFLKKYETFLMLLMGAVCIAFQEEVYNHFSIIFGFFMLERSVHGTVEGWKNRDFYNKEQLMLLFEPLDNVEHHILILGIQLIVEGVLDLLIKTRERIRDMRES